MSPPQQRKGPHGNGRFFRSRPSKKANTLVSKRYRMTGEVNYFRMANAWKYHLSKSKGA
jgi:hypothetical protein